MNLDYDENELESFNILRRKIIAITLFNVQLSDVRD